MTDLDDSRRYRSRKFRLALASLVVSSVALFTGHIGGGEWLGAVGLVLGLYGAANVAEKR